MSTINLKKKNNVNDMDNLTLHPPMSDLSFSKTYR